MSRLDLHIPPVVVALVCAGAMLGVRAAWPSGVVGLPGRGRLAGGLVAAGVGVAVAGVVAFRRARTTVNPTRPDASSALVTGGVYRISRNPMYVGMALALAGVAVALAHPAALLGPAAFVAYLTRFQIHPEERALRAAFGDAFEAYERRVRRWL